MHLNQAGPLDVSSNKYYFVNFNYAARRLGDDPPRSKLEAMAAKDIADIGELLYESFRVSRLSFPCILDIESDMC